VDEFQDTSRKQWELVSLLVKAWGEGLGIANQPSIFIVGDRKQSIYRFRDADVAVLEDASAFIEALGQGSTARRSITRSFRAVPELLAFVNDLFTEIAGRSERARMPDAFRYDAADRFPIDVVEDARGPALGIAVAEDPVECAAAVATEIARILREESVRDRQTGVARQARPGDIAILFRSRTSHREFERELEAHSIPTYVYKGLGFFDADEIKDISALIRFLANPASDLRAAALLRSRFIRLSDEALSRLAPRLAAALTDETPPSLDGLRDDDRRALERARASVPRWIAQVDRVPPADLIEAILPETAYAYELRGPRFAQAWENVKKMRGLIRRIQNRGYATLARIADHLDSLTAGDESNAVLEALDAVNLMTVHAAKGLEFPIVFLVNLAKGATGPPKPVRLAGEEVAVGPFVSDTDEEEKLREREETKRLLYVALTRARDRLYVASVLKDGVLVPGRGSLAEVLPESFRGLFARAATSFSELDRLAWTSDSGRVFEFRRCAPGDRAADARVAPGNRAVQGDRLDELIPDQAVVRESVIEQLQDSEGGPAAAEPENRVVGAIVHRLFQWSSSLPPEATHDRAVEFARTLVRPDDLAGVRDARTLATRAVDAWRSMRDRQDVTQLLGGGDRLHEVPFSMVVNEEPRRILRGSIDCLVRRPDGSVTVVEFKTGRPKPEHEIQLGLYVRAAQAMYPGSTVDGRLVYPR